MSFADLLNQPIDPKWTAILKKVDELIEEHGPMSMRSQAYTAALGKGEGKFCILKIRAKKGGDPDLMFHISCYESHRGALEVKVDGPYEDHHDAYWADQYQYDKGEKRFGIVDDTWTHYTISPDVAEQNRDMAGHGGTEFRFLLTYRTDVEKARRLGFKVNPCDNGSMILVSRNVWFQGSIPRKFRSDTQSCNYGQVMFIQNAKTLYGRAQYGLD